MSSAYGQMGETDRGRRTCTLARSHKAQWGVGTGGAEKVHALSCLALLARPTFLKWSRNCSTPSSCIDCRKSIAAFFLAWITTAAILAEGPAHPAARCCSASPAVRGRGSGSLIDASRTLAAPQHAGVGTCALTARSSGARCPSPLLGF